MLRVLYIFYEFELLKTTAGHQNRERKSIYLTLPPVVKKVEGGGGADDDGVSVLMISVYTRHYSSRQKMSSLLYLLFIYIEIHII